MLQRLIRFYRRAQELGLDADVVARPLHVDTDKLKEFVLCFGHSTIHTYHPKDGRPTWWEVSCGPVVKFYTEDDPRGWLPSTPRADPALEDPITALLAVQTFFGEVDHSEVRIYRGTPETAVALFQGLGEDAIPMESSGSKWVTNQECAGFLTIFLTKDEPCLTQ